MRLRPGQTWQDNALLKAAIANAEATLAGQGRVLIRPSGTEPLLRVMVEARDANLASSLANQMADAARAG